VIGLLPPGGYGLVLIHGMRWTLGWVAGLRDEWWSLLMGGGAEELE